VPVDVQGGLRAAVAAQPPRSPPARRPWPAAPDRRDAPLPARRPTGTRPSAGPTPRRCSGRDGGRRDAPSAPRPVRQRARMSLPGRPPTLRAASLSARSTTLTRPRRVVRRDLIRQVAIAIAGGHTTCREHYSYRASSGGPEGDADFDGSSPHWPVPRCVLIRGSGRGRPERRPRGWRRTGSSSGGRWGRRLSSETTDGRRIWRGGRGRR